MIKAKVTVTVIDTNVYGWYLAYALDGSRKAESVGSFVLLSRILELKRPTVLGTETIEQEIKAAGKPALSQLFYSVVAGIIKKTKKVDELAWSYYNSCKKERLNLVTIDDCEIVASAAISEVKVLVTENRRTLNNPKVVREIEKVNAAKGINGVKMMDSKSALGDIFV